MVWKCKIFLARSLHLLAQAINCFVEGPSHKLWTILFQRAFILCNLHTFTGIYHLTSTLEPFCNFQEIAINSRKFSSSFQEIHFWDVETLLNVLLLPVVELLQWVRGLPQTWLQQHQETTSQSCWQWLGRCPWFRRNKKKSEKGNQTILKAIIWYWQIWMHFHHSLEKWGILTPDIRKLQTTKNHFKRQIEGQQWITGGSYVHKPMVKLLGAPNNFFVCVCLYFSKYYGFRQNNSQGFQNS